MAESLKRFILPVLFLILFAGCQSGLSRQDAARVYYNVGNAYLDLGKPDQATEYYSKAIKMDRRIREPNYNLARAFIEQGLYAEAEEVLMSLLEIDQENTMVFRTFGYLYYKKGDNKKAMEYFNRVLEIDPADKNALLNAGIVSELEKKDEEAFEYYKRLYTLAPEGLVVKRLGILAARMGRAEERKLYLEAYLSKNPSDKETLITLRDVYIEEQAYALALEKTEQLIDSSPDDKKPVYWFDKGRILIIYVMEYQKGLEAISKALELGFKDRDAVKDLMSKADPQVAGSLADLFKPKGLYP